MAGEGQPEVSKDVEASFRPFYLELYPKVVSVAMAAGQEIGPAEEIAQRVFREGWKRWSKSPERARTWLLRRAAALALDGTGPAPGRKSALARLGRRKALLLSLYFGGLSYGELPKAIRLSPSRVAARLRRAEALLRREIHDETYR